MYVNERTLDYGEDGRAAVAKLLNMGHDQGIIRPPIKLEWISQPV
jgi:1,4-dihydroxy-6-naphthoate synthase